MKVAIKTRDVFGETLNPLPLKAEFSRVMNSRTDITFSATFKV
jgi:hypothetical protein